MRLGSGHIRSAAWLPVCPRPPSPGQGGTHQGVNDVPSRVVLRTVTAMPAGDLRLRAFEDVDVPVAAALLGRRHARHRLAQPLLSPHYELPGHSTAAEAAGSSKAAVAEAFAQEGASGAIAERDGRAVGFLIGSPKPTDPWGPNVWVESAGQAADEPEIMRDLYGYAAARWVDEGRTAHYVLVPAHDERLVRAWFRLGFGQQHVHGIRPVPERDDHPQPGVSRGLTIRPAERADIPELARLDLALPLHQGLAPVFSSKAPDSIEQNIAEWTDDIDDADFPAFVAVRDGKVIGSVVACSIEHTSMHTRLARPENAGFLGFAAVFPQDRGRGAGRALGETVLNWARDQGFASVVTDWRVTNLLSSRTWPALGFTETFLRLHRLIGY